MKRLLKGLVCTVSVISLILPDMAMAAAQMQPERQTRQRRAQTRPARPSPQRPTTRPAHRPTRPARPVQGNRPGRPSIQPVRPGRPSIQPVRPGRPPTYRPGHRPSTFHRIRGRTFHYPRGYRYRRFRIGLLLPALFLSSAYYFNDYYSLGIGPPPPGYVWVRYGPDLLLVNRHTGRIADVIYGAFY